MISICRRELNDILEVIRYLNDSDSSSSDEEDIHLLVIQEIASFSTEVSAAGTDLFG